MSTPAIRTNRMSRCSQCLFNIIAFVCLHGLYLIDGRERDANVKKYMCLLYVDQFDREFCVCQRSYTVINTHVSELNPRTLYGFSMTNIIKIRMRAFAHINLGRLHRRDGYLPVFIYRTQFFIPDNFRHDFFLLRGSVSRVCVCSDVVCILGEQTHVTVR